MPDDWDPYRDAADHLPPGERERIADQEQRDALAFTLPAPIDWVMFWKQGDTADDDWLVEPFIARGRGHAVPAKAKVGKSLFVLNVAAALATGAPILDRPAGDPVHVVYLDYEMTAGDLYDRLTDMGYGPTTDLTCLHYYQLPAMPPLDTAQGGIIVEHLVEEHHAALVVIDTFARATQGKENDADTVRDFYAHTGARLKRAGVAYVRLDNEGKDPDKGARGTSGKNDDVDVVWKLTPTSDGLRITATHQRMTWVPQSFTVARDTDPLNHRRTEGGWPAGTADLAVLLDTMGVPATASVNTAHKVLRDAGAGRRKDVVSAAQRWRKEREPPSGTTL